MGDTTTPELGRPEHDASRPFHMIYAPTIYSVGCTHRFNTVAEAIEHWFARCAPLTLADLADLGWFDAEASA